MFEVVFLILFVGCTWIGFQSSPNCLFTRGVLIASVWHISVAASLKFALLSCSNMPPATKKAKTAKQSVAECLAYLDPEKLDEILTAAKGGASL